MELKNKLMEGWHKRNRGKSREIMDETLIGEGEINISTFHLVLKMLVSWINLIHFQTGKDTNFLIFLHQISFSPSSVQLVATMLLSFCCFQFFFQYVVYY